MTTWAQCMQTGKFFDGRVCIDCLIAITDAEYNGISADWDENQFVRTCEEYTITAGHCHYGQWSTCPHMDEPCEIDCDCERTDYSTSHCDVCKCRAAGERHDVIMVKRADITSVLPTY